MSRKRAKQARRAAIQGTTKSAPPERPLPMGVQLRVVSDPDTMRMVDSAAAEFISDYSPPAQMARGLEQRWSGLQSLFAGDPRPVPSIFAVVAVNDAGDGMYGAATLEPFLGEDLASQDREVARNVAALHRVLGSLFVVPDARGDGIGARSWTQQASLSCRTRAATWKDSSMTGTAASGSTAAPAPTSDATTNRCRPGRRSISRPRTTPERTGTGSRSMAGHATPSCLSAADAARLPTSIPRPTGCRTALGVRGPGRPRLTELRREPRGRWCARPRPAGCDAAGSSSFRGWLVRSACGS